MNSHDDRLTPVTRHQTNVLAVRERQLLTWLCARLPRWVSPDMLTVFAIMCAVLVLVGYAASNLDRAWLWLSIAGYVGHWFGDSLDGSIARFRKIERPSYGYFIDHSSDGLTPLIMLGGFGLSPWVRIDVALFAVVAYLLLSIHSFLLAKVSGDFPMAHGGMGPTEARLLLIGLTLAMLLSAPGAGGFGAFSFFDCLFIGLTGVLLFMFLRQTWLAGRRLAASDRAFRRTRRDD